MPDIQLSWQPGFSLLRKPARRPRLRRKRQQPFEFVQEHPRKAGRQKHRVPVITSTQSNTPSASTEQFDAASKSCSSSRNRELEPRILPSTISGIGEQNINRPWPISMPTSPLTHMSSPSSATIPPTIEYSSLTERFKPILERYNSEFCTIPLTFHLRINPFRFRTDLDPEPDFLVHAVMALAGHHVNSISCLSHRHAALRLLRYSLDAVSDAEAMYSVLDTIIILFSLDETQSIHGNWSTHLMGAYGLIEACGGITNFARSSRIEAQIGLLTWWDAIISLLSREECIFPYEYFDFILSNQHKREWDFFGLCGCPTSLAKIVMQLARHIGERRKPIVPSSVAFEDTKLSEIEQRLESWLHVPAPSASRNERSMLQDEDFMHCSEAWRNGLLLYIFRVFRWEPEIGIPMHILQRAKVIVDHVILCRDSHMISKQALLPLFFAGCELKNRSTRAEIVKLCSTWDERTSYHMFSSTIPLLKEVWLEQDRKGFAHVWWGQIVDKLHTAKAEPLQMRLCFG